ncbi:MAG: hypothetical protein OEY34_04145, partial [Cyclobacteriaceae bacterium]|nr:hypothetical protein [Cyclobacteriaceae bacterium]
TQFVDTTITNLRNLAPAWDRMKNSLNEDGMLMRRNFQSISENLKGIIGANKKQWTTEAISAELDRTYDMARSAEAGFMQEIENATSGLAGLMSLLGAYTTPVSGDSSYEFEALQPGADFTEWIDNDLYTFIIDAQNIIIEMEAAIAISNSEEKYRIYELQPGESYDSIAEKVLGTKDLGQALSIWNEDTKGKLARHSIRIPIGTETGIFTKLPFNPSPRDLEIGLVGVDLKLTVQRDFAVAPNGDLAIISGDESLINSLLDLVDVPQGSWIADLSKGNPVPIGELPNTIINGGFILDLLSQIQKNPKVETAEFTGLEQDGDVLMYLFNVYSVSGRSYVIEL